MAVTVNRVGYIIVHQFDLAVGEYHVVQVGNEDRVDVLQAVLGGSANRFDRCEGVSLDERDKIVGLFE